MIVASTTPLACAGRPSAAALSKLPRRSASGRASLFSGWEKLTCSTCPKIFTVSCGSNVASGRTRGSGSPSVMKYCDLLALSAMPPSAKYLVTKCSASSSASLESAMRVRSSA
eukprot:3816282-Amphidinium_carterae.1